MGVCEWLYVLHNLVAVVKCVAAQKWKLGSYNLEYNWRVGWEGGGFCKCQDREGVQDKNKLHGRGRESMEVTFLRLTFNVSWALVMLMAHGVRGKASFNPSPSHLLHLLRSQLLKFGKDQVALQFFSLCDILKSWKILWDSFVYRAHGKALPPSLFIYLLLCENALP